MSHVAAACAFPISSHVVPKGDTPRCQAALLFSNLLLGGLLPLLLLAPSGSDARRGPLASSALARLERGLCRALRLFIHEQHPGEGGHTERVFLLPPLVLRWVVLVTCTWCCCCLLYS